MLRSPCRMGAALSLLAVAALFAAGCGGGNTSAPVATTPSAKTSTRNTATAPSTIPLELFYLADDGKLVAERGDVPATQAVASAALHALASAASGTTTVLKVTVN